MTEKYPGHYETVKCFELVNNYNCSKKHKCLKKILDETKIYDIIINEAVAYSFGVVSSDEIDEINILQATYKAMRQAIFKVRILVAQLF